MAPNATVVIYGIIFGGMYPAGIPCVGGKHGTVGLDLINSKRI